MVTPGSFRQLFNGFANRDIYSDATLTLWLGVAANLIDPKRWGSLYDYGTSLWVAHQLALVQRDILTGLAGGVPGAPQGVLSGKSVDKVSSSYDASAVTLENGGPLNQTRFGTEFLRMLRLVGAGGMQISGC